MKHRENRSQTWFKILTPEGRDLDNEMKKWFLPEGVKKGEWFTSGFGIGTWLVSIPKEFMQKTNRVFVVELDGEEPIKSSVSQRSYQPRSQTLRHIPCL